MISRRGRGGILLDPGRSLRGLKAAKNSQKGIAALLPLPPPPRREGCGRLSAPYTAGLRTAASAVLENRRPKAARPPCLSHLQGLPGAGPAAPALSEVGNRGGVAAANTLKPKPTARPHHRRALPATLRSGAGPDTAAQGLREDPTNARLPPPPTGLQSGFAHLGPEPIARTHSTGHSSQSDART